MTSMKEQIDTGTVRANIEGNGCGAVQQTRASRLYE